MRCFFNYLFADKNIKAMEDLSSLKTTYIKTKRDALKVLHFYYELKQEEKRLEKLLFSLDPDFVLKEKYKKMN